MKKASYSAFVPFAPWLLALLALAVPAHAQPVSGLVPWGDNFFGQLNLPAGLTNVAAIASGFGHNLALSRNGTVVAWGDNAGGQANVPPGLSGVRAITAGSSHSLALRTNGTLVAWGTAQFALNSVPGGLGTIVGIGSGSGASHNLVIRSDGTVTGWGDNGSGQLTIPSGLSNVVAVGGGIFHSLALKADGTLAAWGNNSFQQTAIPPGVSNVVAIAVGVYHNVALRANGTVVIWGDNSHGQLNVSPGLSNVIAIACGDYHSLAVKADGTLVGWGYNSAGQAQPPVGLTNVVAVSAGNAHSLALAGSAPLIIAQPHDLTVVESFAANFSVGAVGFPAVSYQWRFNGTNLAGATGSSLTLAPVHLTDAGSYSVRVANTFGSVTSAPALLTVTPLLVARCADVTVSADVNCVANASIDAGSTNPSGGTITLTQSPPGPYPLGTNLVTLMVSDDHGGSASCSARVIVLDQTPPQLTPPTAILTANDSDQCGAIVTFALPAATDTCSAVALITCSPPSGSFFPVGPTVVQCAAADAVGNIATTNFTVTVYDNQPPALVCPADIVVTNAPGASTSIVAYSPIASDNCPGLGPVICNPPSGSAFGAGVHTVNCSVTDAAGNSSVCSFHVTVIMNHAPTVANPIADQTGVFGAAFDFTMPPNTFADEDAGQTLTYAAYDLPPGISFTPDTATFSGTFGAAGQFTVTVTATDNGVPVPLSATNAFVVTVQKADLVLAWPTPADIVYGTALGAAQLNATANVAGTFAYNPAAGTVLHAANGQTLSVTFVPDDTTNYNSASTNVLINVSKATLTLAWPAPADIVYGTALGAAQLNATANVAGTFAYNPAAGTVLHAANGQTLSVTFVPDDTTDYNSASANVLINVSKATLTLAWPAPADIVYGTALGAAQLNAAANVTGTFVYNPSAGTVLHTANGQTLSVTFAPDDTANYNPASANALINVSKATLTATAADKSRTYGAANPPLTINYSGFVNGDTSAVLDSQPVASTTATSTSPAGTYPITLSGGTDNDYNLGLVNGTLTVTRAPLIVTAGSATKIYGQPNPPFSGNIWGIQNNDNITATYSSAATDTSLAGSYPIVPTLVDPDGKLSDYSVSLINGTLTITPATLSVTITGPSSGFVQSVNTNILFTGCFTPSSASSSYLAWWTFSSDGMSDIVIPGIVSNHTVSAQVQFPAAGVYSFTLTVTNESGPSAVATSISNDLPAYVVIYDPDGGFVTGGGWLNSPAGAYVLDSGLVGRATFGFVSKYKHGATIPDGQTQFSFQIADVDFHSTSYDWLVISGAKAQYQGSGTINGQGDFGFILTAVDGQVNGGGGVDKFRMKIWEKQHNILIYDNQLGASDNSEPTTAIQAGSIVIHKK